KEIGDAAAQPVGIVTAGDCLAVDGPLVIDRAVTERLRWSGGKPRRRAPGAMPTRRRLLLPKPPAAKLWARARRSAVEALPGAVMPDRAMPPPRPTPSR